MATTGAWSDPGTVDTYIWPGPEPRTEEWLLPWTNPRSVNTLALGFNVTNLWSNPAYMSTVRATTPWSMTDGGAFVPLSIDFA